MPVELITSLIELLPPGSAVKLEEPPTSPKIARPRELAGDVPIYGRLGGVALVQELEAGADGTMTGFGYPEALVGVVREHRAGDVDTARRLCEEILRRRGAIRHATVRQPAPALDETTLAELDGVMG